MNAIGGYFELADYKDKCALPIDGVALNTSRNALEFILRSLPDATHVYLPLYTCEAVIEPFSRLSHVSYSFYHIDINLEMSEDISLKDGEYLVANNYFGLKDVYIEKLAEKYGDRLIIDNAQAFFAPIIPEIKAIYSARKFVGVADGGFAVGGCDTDVSAIEVEDTSSHDDHLLIRKQYGAEAGFSNYRNNESRLDNQPIRRMSEKTADILSHIDYLGIKHKRKSNFQYLHSKLEKHNELRIPSIDTFACPMVYPYYIDNGVVLRKRLIENKVFVAKYWPNISEWAAEEDLEYSFASNILPIPIDQRYSILEMEFITKLLLQY